jgi:hypothetical protein
VNSYVKFIRRKTNEVAPNLARVATSLVSFHNFIDILTCIYDINFLVLTLWFQGERYPSSLEFACEVSKIWPRNCFTKQSNSDSPGICPLVNEICHFLNYKSIQTGPITLFFCILTFWFSRERCLDNPDFDCKMSKVCSRIIFSKIKLRFFQIIHRRRVR